MDGFYRVGGGIHRILDFFLTNFQSSPRLSKTSGFGQTSMYCARLSLGLCERPTRAPEQRNKGDFQHEHGE